MLFTFPSRYWFAIGLSVVFSLAGWSPPIPAEFLVFRGTQVPARRGFAFRLGGCHPLRPGFPAGSATLRHWLRRGSYNPDGALTPAVWALARSLATTCAIIVIFSSCGYLDVSVPRVPSCKTMDSSYGDRFFTCRVSPFGYLRIGACLRLPVAFRSLPRPSSAYGARASTLCSL